ncbi:MULTISPECIES: Crp/Fnr family transcriptional regulator [unclassified Variovorax]|uniref:Crp/Fnr family transcriptional regulator n=1 Tax=unclassified Variovorax TaxID=663243 RepID=UPI0013A5B88F|nr:MULTISPECIES: Crp/Fnr family transcriptional regulator [unclassified Variovorax]
MSKALLGLPQAFSNLPDHARQKLAESATVRTFARNEVVIPPGQLSPPVVALRSGLLVLSFTGDVEGGIASDFVRPLDVFSGSTRLRIFSSGTLSAVSASAAVLWPVEAFREALLSSADFAVWYLDGLERRLAHHYLHRARVVHLSGEAQYAYFLWAMSEPTTDGRRLMKVKIPQQLVASYLGVGREEVSRRKTLLEKTGHISQTSAGLELMDSIVHLFSLEDAGSRMPGELPFVTGLDA